MNLYSVLPWVLSLLTFMTMWWAGNKDVRAWYLGLFSQVIWIIFDLHVHAYGLLPIGAGLGYIYVRNIMKWRAESSK